MRAYLATMAVARWVCVALATLAALAAQRVEAQGGVYTQSKAQSFLAMTRDVLAAVAPSIDPIYKLAAQTSITLNASVGSHDRTIAQAIGGSMDYSVVDAQTVAYFRAYVTDPNALVLMLAAWAGVDTRNIVVVRDDVYGTTKAQDVANGGAVGIYNVTVLPPVLAKSNPYVVGNSAQALVDTLPQNMSHPTEVCDASSCTGGCCRLLCYYAGLPEFINSVRTWSPTGGGCDTSFTNGGIGKRYTIDLFTAYDTPNVVTVASLAARWAGSGAIGSRLPTQTLQFLNPTALGEPGPMDLTVTVIASLCTSAAVMLVMLVTWRRLRVA